LSHSGAKPISRHFGDDGRQYSRVTLRQARRRYMGGACRSMDLLSIQRWALEWMNVCLDQAALFGPTIQGAGRQTAGTTCPSPWSCTPDPQSASVLKVYLSRGGAPVGSFRAGAGCIVYASVPASVAAQARASYVFSGGRPSKTIPDTNSVAST